jgi:hypothetical protein
MGRRHVGHRALVAYARSDGRYDLHRSQWGGLDAALADRITERTPLGRISPPASDSGSDARPDHVAAAVGTLRALLSELGVTASGGWLDRSKTDPPVDPEPLTVGVALGDIASHVDLRGLDLVFVVGTDWQVTTYLPVPFALPAAGPSDGGGALLAVGPGECDRECLRRAVAAVRAVLDDATEHGDLSATRAAGYIERRVREWGRDREVVRVS